MSRISEMFSVPVPPKVNPKAGPGKSVTSTATHTRTPERVPFAAPAPKKTVCVTVSASVYRLLDLVILEDMREGTRQRTKSDLVADAMRGLLGAGVDSVAARVDMGPWLGGGKVKRNLEMPNGLLAQMSETATLRRIEGLPFATRTALVELAIVSSYSAAGGRNE